MVHVVTGPKPSGGKQYSSHKSESDAMKHIAKDLESRGANPTVKNAIDRGYKITHVKEYQKPEWKEK